MSGSSFNAHSEDEALAQYAQLSSSPNPNDKLLALGGLIQFIQHSVDQSFLLRCAEVTDYYFLDKMIRNGICFVLKKSYFIDLKTSEELAAERGHFSQLAITVFGVFAKLDEMKARPQVLDRIPALLEAFGTQYVLLCRINADQRDEVEQSDIVDTLQVLGTVQNGANFVLTPLSISILLKHIESEPKILHEIFQLLLTVLKNASPTISPLALLEDLAHLFSITKSLTQIQELTTFFIVYFTTNSPAKSLYAPLYNGIKSLTLSKLDDATRAKTTILLSLLLNRIGPSFLFTPPPCSESAKQMAGITIHLTSAGVQTSINRASLTPMEIRLLIAELDILYVTTAWLLSSDEDEPPKIGNEKLNADEILRIQESISAAIRQTSLFLRGKYDNMKAGQGTFDASDPVVASAVKLVGEWIGEGGTSQDEEALGLVEVFLALCSTLDTEIVTWSMSGLKGIVLYSDDGLGELMAHKDQLIPLLSLVLEHLEGKISDEAMLMVQELCNVFRILLGSQPLLLTEQTVKSFPLEVYNRLSVTVVDKITWAVRTEAAIFSLEILLKMGEEQSFDPQFRELLRKWAIKVRELIRLQNREDTLEDLQYLAAALEKLSFESF